MKAIITAMFIFAASPVHAETALEFAAAGMGQLRSAERLVNRTFMHRVAIAEGRMVLTSWYGGGERLNRHIASGEVFRPRGLTAAHRSLPLGTRLAVSYGGRTVVVRVNDRGPHIRTGRSLDLSRGAAQAIGIVHAGVARVRITVLN